ncbi:PH domain-containing protein [Virgibacillus sp. SK37]|uniref:PH domain-containing protein n=1 Tax=Virgibacillus sp. SK37 TaxID=403957 RepID=UPI0004D14DF0|nr:PH domain-containing protein [Virgibacillus sp. SK37]AIF43147.1 membrane protein [Virgibacillus sp. SK37]
MKQLNRYHPLSIVFDIWKTAKNSFFAIFYLYILNFSSDSTFIYYARMIFLFLMGITLITIFLKWYTYKYSVKETSFELYHGIIKKTKKTVPFSKIQNVNRHTSLFHRLFKVTSIHFETGTAEDSSVKFPVITIAAADQLEEYITEKGEKKESNISSEDLDSSEKSDLPNRKTVHFQPRRKDIVKASFTSLSFLVLIPILGSIYSKMNQVLDLEERAEGYLSYLLDAWWMIIIFVLILGCVSLLIGMVWTFLKYGKYEISSDEERIYIKKGIMETTEFSILKSRVQAVEVSQTFMKRLLGLAEVKLTSAGSFSGGEELEVNTLYPFLPLTRAYELITELLPTYEVASNLHSLPKKSLGIRLLKPSWFWAIATGALFYFHPVFFHVEMTWLILSILLLALIVLARVLDYYHTGYLVQGQFIQFKTGGFTTTTFLSRRDKIIEVGVSRNLIQQFLGLATVTTVNRAQPVYHNTLTDVPLNFTTLFYSWYMEREKEVEHE